jgi:ubiquinone/menaquinone biosynthesis C-methylase UbiE
MAESYLEVWEKIFSRKEWGEYPPEDLIRFVKRNSKDTLPRILEIGCGPGANLPFLAKHATLLGGVDFSQTAISLAKQRMARFSDLNLPIIDLRCGDLTVLPWNDSMFDMVVDIFALYANPTVKIRQALREVARVLYPGGLMYSKVWSASNIDFYELGHPELEKGTFSNSQVGPCANMGVSHYFESAEIEELWHDAGFEIMEIYQMSVRSIYSGFIREEYQISARLPT